MRVLKDGTWEAKCGSFRPFTQSADRLTFSYSAPTLSYTSLQTFIIRVSVVHENALHNALSPVSRLRQH